MGYVGLPYVQFLINLVLFIYTILCTFSYTLYRIYIILQVYVRYVGLSYVYFLINLILFTASYANFLTTWDYLMYIFFFNLICCLSLNFFLSIVLITFALYIFYRSIIEPKCLTRHFCHRHSPVFDSILKCAAAAPQVKPSMT